MPENELAQRIISAENSDVEAFTLGPLLVFTWLTVNMYYWNMLGLLALGAAALAYVYWANGAVTAEPFNQLPIWFAALLVVGIGFFIAVRARNPKAADAAGTFADENPEKI